MSDRMLNEPSSAEELSQPYSGEEPLRVYRLPRLGPVRPAGRLRGPGPWEKPEPEGTEAGGPVREYYFA